MNVPDCQLTIHYSPQMHLLKGPGQFFHFFNKYPNSTIFMVRFLEWDIILWLRMGHSRSPKVPSALCKSITCCIMFFVCFWDDMLIANNLSMFAKHIVWLINCTIVQVVQFIIDCSLLNLKYIKVDVRHVTCLPHIVFLGDLSDRGLMGSLGSRPHFPFFLSFSLVYYIHF